jgi:hypothetical protein
VFRDGRRGLRTIALAIAALPRGLRHRPADASAADATITTLFEARKGRPSDELNAAFRARLDLVDVRLALSRTLWAEHGFTIIAGSLAIIRMPPHWKPDALRLDRCSKSSPASSHDASGPDEVHPWPIAAAKSRQRPAALEPE